MDVIEINDNHMESMCHKHYKGTYYI